MEAETIFRKGPYSVEKSACWHPDLTCNVRDPKLALLDKFSQEEVVAGTLFASSWSSFTMLATIWISPPRCPPKAWIRGSPESGKAKRHTRRTDRREIASLRPSGIATYSVTLVESVEVFKDLQQSGRRDI